MEEYDQLIFFHLSAGRTLDSFSSNHITAYLYTLIYPGPYCYMLVASRYYIRLQNPLFQVQICPSVPFGAQINRKTWYYCCESSAKIDLLISASAVPVGGWYLLLGVMRRIDRRCTGLDALYKEVLVKALPTVSLNVEEAVIKQGSG
jgi:hypothetical protein